ncbi:MAG: TonB-dependent receptor [Bacteroidetes bacterium]|nr:TonB-dependent receptor [Bacteroidota bacterium]
MRKHHALLLLCILFIQAKLSAQTNTTISGYVREKGSKELLIGVNVYVPSLSTGISTNTYGFYSLTLPKTDSLTLVFSFVGYSKKIVKLPFNRNQEYNVELESDLVLDELIVNAQRQDNALSETPQMSKIDIPVNQIKKIPTLLGEKDVLKVIQLMPGVQKGSEGSSGLYVRGGGPDQNLIILDDANVYNASHLFGFFSTFNGDAIKSVELTKGGFPARYGGRLSSVVEMNMKDGNKQKLSGEGGIGLISSRLVLEGPIKLNKNKPVKASYIVSGRRTYLDVVSRPFIKAQNKKSGIDGTGGYFFYDLNAKLNFELGSKDKLYLSGYFGRDIFTIKSNSSTETFKNGINWGNATSTLRWNHQFNQKLFANTSLIFSDYQFNISGEEKIKDIENDRETSFLINYQSAIRDFSLKYDLDFFLNRFHTFRIGLQTTAHHFTPEASILKDSQSNLNFENKKTLNTLESGIYLEDTWHPVENIKVNAGLRFSHYLTDGKQYFKPEPRISASYKFSKDMALKASYAEMNQYLHLLSNTGIGLPTDLWVPSTTKTPPQHSRQFAVGLAKDLNEAKGISITLEGYYKNMNRIINYKEGASFLEIGSPEVTDKNTWEDKITSGIGESYGIEFLLQKKIGKFSGWAGYTLSRTVWQFPELNFGQEFFPKYDRRHDISLVGIYEVSKRITLSSTWVYGTGNALTVPISEYSAYVNGGSSNPGWTSNGVFPYQVNEYGGKNSFRAEPYHRLDFGIQFHKQKKRHERTWDFSVYNVYNRKNPFFYTVGSNLSNNFFGGNNFQNIDQKMVLKRYSLFPIVPSFSYNFKF